MRIRTEDGVNGVHGDLVLGGITNQPLGVGEGNVRRCCSVPLIISDDLNPVVLPNSDAGVGRSETIPMAGPSPLPDIISEK